MYPYLKTSFDSETWGVLPGCDIRSIGATVHKTSRHLLPSDFPFDFYMATHNPIIGTNDDGSPKYKYKLHREARTVTWWAEMEKRHPELAQAFACTVDLKEALQSYSDWLENIRILSGKTAEKVLRFYHGSHFDDPKLVMACEATGVDLRSHYRSPRDTRSVFDEAGIYNHGPWLEKHRAGILHHALYDAITQGDAVDAAQLLRRAG